MEGMPQLELVHGDNLAFLERAADDSFPLIYVDPPFNTGKRQVLESLETTRDEDGDRTGFAGRRYASRVRSSIGYDDRHDDYLAFLAPRLEQAARVLTPTGSLFVHLDPREAHYVKVFLDGLFGRASFQNEIVWAYDYGARSRKRWSPKHDTILWYTPDPKRYTYRYEDIDRVPYLAEKLAGARKAARGKTPTDVWWQTIVPPGGKERTGYPTQKPLAILERIVRVHSNPGDHVLDFFAGSGTTGEAAIRNGRPCTLVDAHPEAIRVMGERLAFAQPRVRVLQAAAPASEALPGPGTRS